MSWFVPAFDLWLHVTIAGLALTAAAALAVLVLREPARKIRVIQLTFVGLLALPALALLPGYPRVSWWPAAGEIEPIALLTKSPPAKPRAAPVLIPQRIQPPALPGGSSAPEVDAAASGPAQPATDATPPASVAATAVPKPTPPAATTPIIAAPPIVVPNTSEPTAIVPLRSTRPAAAHPPTPARIEFPALPDYRLLVISAYLLGVAVFAVWWLLGRIAMWRLLRTSVPAEPHVRAMLDDTISGSIAKHHAVRVRLLVSPRAAQPCAFGWLRPTIVLPQRVVNELTPDRLRLALSHEWSHVARGDIRTWMLAGIVRLVHFHQPLVWLLRRELRISQDYLADAAAASCSTPEDYAELLTTLSRMLRPTPLSPGLGIASRQSELYRRVVMLVDQSRPLERTIPRQWNLAVVILGIALIAGVATLRAEPEAKEPPQADQAQNASPDSAPTEQITLSPEERNEKRDALTALQREQFTKEIARLNATELGFRLNQLRTELAEHLANPGTPRGLISSIERQIVQVQEAIDVRQREHGATDNPSSSSLARPKTRQELLDDPTDRRDIALELVTVGRQLESLLKTRKSLQVRLANGEHNPQDQTKLEQLLANIDDRIAEASQRFVEIQAHFDEASLKDYVSAHAAAANWEPSGDKRRTVEALWAELDQLLKLRDQMFKQAAEQTNSKDREPLEIEVRRLDQKRFEIAQRIEELLLPEATSSVAAASAKDPELLAKAILHNEPQYVEFQEELSKRQLLLSEQRSSGAAREVLDKSQRSVLQLEEHIEEWKAARMPALLELVTAYSALDGQPRAATERGGRAATEPQGRAASGSQPFSGRIRPGDILGIELVGGFPTPLAPTRTVEPDGNLALGPIYGPASRVNVAGMTLIEAGQAIEKQLKAVLRDPKVMLTYEGHNDGVVAEGVPAEASSTAGKPAPATEPVILQPLDTIEVILPLKSIRSHIKEVNGNPTEVTTGDPPRINNTYLIEPDGRIALPEAAGRLALAGLTEEAAGEKLREHLAKTVYPRKALPTTRVLRRGRATFADGKQPAADYKIQPGDFLVLRSTSLGSWGTESESQVDAEGKFGWGPRINIAGMTLEEAQRAFRREVKSSAGTPSEQSIPWLITLGGWREEADPRVIDLIEGNDATQLLRMQEEMQELKSMIRRLQAE